MINLLGQTGVKDGLIIESVFESSSLFEVTSAGSRVSDRQLMCLNSGSASFRGAFEGQLHHNAEQMLSPLTVICIHSLLSSLLMPVFTTH